MPFAIVESLLVKNAHYGGIFITKYADSSIVRYCEVTSSGTGIEVQGRYSLVKGNYLHDLKMVVNTSGGIDDYGATGVLIENSRNEACYNRMVNCRAMSYDFGTDGGVVDLYADCDSCSIHHNIGINCDGFLEVGGGSTRYTAISYNISINNGPFAEIHLAGTFASVVQDLRIDNNTIVDTATRTPAEYAVIGFDGTPQPSTLLFRNNIVAVKAFLSIVKSTGTAAVWSFMHTHNLYYLDSSIVCLGFSLDSTEKLGSPLFVDFSGADYHLKPGSPAIQSGMALGYAQDFYGEPVAQFPSMGAVEFGTVSVIPVAGVHRMAIQSGHFAIIKRTGLLITGGDRTSAFTLQGRRIPITERNLKRQFQ